MESEGSTAIFVTAPGQRRESCWVVLAEVGFVTRMTGARFGLVFSLVSGVSALSTEAWAACVNGVGEECVSLRESFPVGPVDFFATGGSFAINDDDDDRPDAVLDVAEVTVPERRIPGRATLERAYLYFGGSLFQDNDGMDAPDMDVEIQVPGSSSFVTATGDQVYQSEPIPGFPEVTLYTVRSDITEIMRAAGGQMVGTYRVRGFAADIFYEDREHTVANASFSIVLVFREPRLPKRRIVLFDGMQEVLGSTVTLDLSGFIVSEIPSGSLTIYALEGDCNPGPESCANGNNLSGLERIFVIGADASRTLVLSDPINPPNDIFNRTINTVDPPLTNVPGTDIDRFDITPVLRPGDQSVTVQVTSPAPKSPYSGELIGLAYVVVGIDVFAPDLEPDSRIEITTARGEKLDAFYPGDPLRVTFALSNTGNLPGTGVTLDTDLPENATAFMVDRIPENAGSTVDETGGAAGKGRVSVDGISVRHGEVQGLTMLVETECPLPEGGTFAISGEVGAPVEGGNPFTLTASVALLPRDICGPRFYLFGGGGCRIAGGRAGGGSLWLGILLIAGLLSIRHGRGRRLAVLLFAGSVNSACGGQINEADRPPPAELGILCPDALDMVAVPALAGRDAFCIDRYEATIEADGSAASTRFVRPARGVTWFQARDACERAGKRLCTADEWQTACRGDADSTYPYGDVWEPSTCNGFDAARRDVVETGGMIYGAIADDGSLVARGCVGPVGAYDLSGNVWEWNATSFFGDTQRGIAGGGYRSNKIGLRCVTGETHAVPDEENDAFGFRCCRDAM